MLPYRRRRPSGTSTARERPYDSGGASSAPAASSPPEHAGGAPRDQPQDRRAVAEAYLSRGCADGAEGVPLHGADAGAGGGLCRSPPADPAAAVRCRRASPRAPAPRCTAASSATAAATCRKWWVRHPPRRSSVNIPSATSTSISPRCAPRKGSSTVRGDRSYREVRRRRAAPARREDGGGAVSPQPHRHGPLYDPHRLTDNGRQFTNRQGDRLTFMHIFDRVCREHNIEHHLTKIAHPWTNGRVERMNRTLKEATVSRYHYATHQQLREHLYNFLMPTISPGASSPSRGSLPISTTSAAGSASHNASIPIRTITPWD